MNIRQRRMCLEVFLIKHKCKELYNTNLVNSARKEGVNPKDVFDSILNNDGPDTVFHSQAFSWRGTPEGERFWENIYNLWMDKFK